MKELCVLAEIERSEILATPTVYQPGIWRYCLYFTGKLLPFMNDTYNRRPVKVNNVIVDHVEYTKFKTVNEMRKKLADKDHAGGWVDGGNIIYVRFPFWNPPHMHYSFLYGVLEGFTNNKPVMIDGRMYRPSIMTTPRIAHTADAFTYDRMRFNSADVSIDNANGQFDDASKLFGNEFNFKVAVVDDDEGREEHYIKTIKEAGDENVVSTESDTGEYVVISEDHKKKEKPEPKMLAQYYIENIAVSLGKAEFKLSDKRERLSAKIPSRQYTNDKGKEHGYYCPDIDDNLLDKDVQEAYGRCFGVPGVCLEGKRIKARDGEPADKKGDLLQYRFRFSSQISRIDRIQVKMTADGWTTIWRREAGEYPEDWAGWKEGVDDPDDPAGDFTSFISEGIITLRWDMAKQGGKRDNRVNEVRMDGVFNDPQERIKNNKLVTPGDIIQHILYEYANVLYDRDRYDIDEFEEELKQLDAYETGILFDKAVAVYEAIEKLQGGSVKGFQFQTRENRFTARLDNPNRAERPAISHLEIINLNEVEVDWNARLYGSYTNIEYAYNYGEKEYRRFIDKKRQKDILALHRMEKEWNVKTLLANEKDAEKKSDILLDDFKNMRPIIRNIQLAGEKWLGLEKGFDELRIYDIMNINFSIPGDQVDKYPQHLIRLIKEAGAEKVVSIESDTDEYIIMGCDEKDAPGKRDFMRTLRCQVIGIAPDIQSGTITIDVRVTERQ